MNPNSNPDIDTISPAVKWQVFMLGLLAIIVGALLASIMVPRWLPGLSASILGESPKIYWFLARATAIVGYLLLWLAMVLGTIITNRIARLWICDEIDIGHHRTQLKTHNLKHHCCQSPSRNISYHIRIYAVKGG